jgi:hypothetical protein
MFLKFQIFWAQWLIPVVPPYLGDRNRRIIVPGQPGQKVTETISKNKPSVIVYICTPATQEVEVDESKSGQPRYLYTCMKIDQ